MREKLQMGKGIDQAELIIQSHQCIYCERISDPVDKYILLLNLKVRKSAFSISHVSQEYLCGPDTKEVCLPTL